jgi:rhamnulokinase
MTFLSMKPPAIAACDLGAESGRVMLGSIERGRLNLEEIHRFPNGALKIAGSLRWNLAALFAELKKGLSVAAQHGREVRSVSVDSWGVDYAYCGEGQPILGLPFHYRDMRTDATYERVQKELGRDRIFNASGLQFMPFNTIYQLADDVTRFRPLLDVATQFLFIADHLNFLFSGCAVAERSLASTSQLYDPVRHEWSDELIERIGMPRRLFPTLVDSGTVIGTLTPEVAAEVGLPSETVSVVASCSHDTGSAVVAVPAEGDDWAYLSSGTWSLLGLELPKALVTPKALELNFTNEIGYGRTIRFLKNIIGLWIVQECRRTWTAAGSSYDYGELTEMAGQATPFRSLINPNDPRFLKPDEMPEKIRAYCRETGQSEPETEGQTVRCVLESLALFYRHALRQMEEVTGRSVKVLHVVGGGSRNSLLNQFTANALAIPVKAGPAEATAAGNVLVQAMALGMVKDLAEARAIVRASFPIETFEPQKVAEWEAVAKRFAELRDRS